VLRGPAAPDDGAGLEATGLGPRTRRALRAAGHRTAEVVVLDRDGVRPLAHHVRHSRDGFGWGYAGSGPSELARCILLDHFDLPGDTDTDWDSPRLPVSYQGFKFDVIARLDQHEPWSISSRQIDEWVLTCRQEANE